VIRKLESERTAELTTVTNWLRTEVDGTIDVNNRFYQAAKPAFQLAVEEMTITPKQLKFMDIYCDYSASSDSDSEAEAEADAKAGDKAKAE
jgi:hypothetical protein